MSAGKLAIVENISFAHKTGSTADYEYSLAGPEGYWEIGKTAYEPKKLLGLESTRHELRFRVKPVTAAEISTIISVAVDVTPIPTGNGYVLDFRAQCRAATACEISFSRLPPGATVQLLSAAKERFDVPQILAVRTGESVRFEAAELRSAGTMRVVTTDITSRDAALAIWNKAPLNTRATTNFSVGADSVVRATHEVTVLKGAPRENIAFFRGSSATSRYQIGRTEHIEGGYMGEYLEPQLRLTLGAQTYAYSALGAMTPGKPGHSILLMPISARNNQDSISTQAQQTPEFIATHEKITLRLPEGFAAEVQLFECQYYSAGTCTSTRHISAQITRDGQTITLKPLEAQISGLWLLKADISGGRFSAPGFWSKFSIGLGHYHIFGRDPRWAFWFWFLIIFGSLVAAIVVFIWLGKRKRRREEEKRLRKLESDAIAGLLKRDPGFSVETFKARGRAIAEKIQHAWSAGDMRDCRRFLSQGVYNRFRLQLKIMREIEGKKNVMADFRITGFDIWNHNQSGNFDCLTVRLNAAARDITINADIPDAEAYRQAVAAPLAAFTEFYSFMRRRDAHSAGYENAEQCSHCGTPFQGEGEITKCKSCGAVAGSGTFDWVLTEITQAVEYKGSPTRKSMGDVSSDRLEDRASFIFWRDLMAQMTANRAYIIRDATDTYLSSAAFEKPQPLFDIAVGAADLETFKGKDDVSRARIRVKWSAAGSRAAEVRHRQSVITLISPANAAAAGGFAEHSCTSCGAPLPETDSTECSYCHSPIQRKNADWLLESVETTIE